MILEIKCATPQEIDEIHNAICYLEFLDIPCGRCLSLALHKAVLEWGNVEAESPQAHGARRQP